MDHKSGNTKNNGAAPQPDMSGIEKDVLHIRELMDVKFEANRATLEKNTADISQMSLILGENVRQLGIHIQGVKELKEMNGLMREEISLFRNQVAAEVNEINSRMTKVEVPFVWFRTTASFAEKTLSIVKIIILIAIGFGADKILSKFLE